MSNDISAKSVDLAKLLSELSTNDIGKVLNSVMEEGNEVLLDAQTRKIACEELGVSTDTAQKWETVSDVIKHFDLSRLCEKHPEAAKATLVKILSLVGNAFVPLKFASLLVNCVPAETLSKLMGFTLKASPDHLVNLLVDSIKNRKQAVLDEYRKEEEIIEGKANLAIVCKDDLLFEQIDKLVSAEDDKDESNVVGTKDGTVRIIRWSEDKWAHKHAAGTINNKVLIIGKTKDADCMLSKSETKFSEYGVSYGWNGNIAVVYADTAAVRDKKTYAEFLSKLDEMEIPDKYKKDFKFKINIKSGLKAALATPFLAKDFYDDKISVTRQLYFYGVIKLYYNDLESFMNNLI